jgi:chorismate mutase/prephenate dehydratase
LLSASGRTISIALRFDDIGMAATTSTIEDLRRRIDEIDDKLHDLIMQRAEIVEVITSGKKLGRVGMIRPGREAQILRRLMARHRGPFPRPILVRLWRELISGAVALQGDFAVAVLAPDKAPDHWDLARDHYGSHTPMLAFHSVGEVLRALAEGRAGAGVLPMPAEGEREPWWPLIAVAAAAPRVMARLPFAGRGNARGDGGLDALAIGYGEPDPTEDDRSMVALELAGELSRARLIGALRSAGLAVTLFAAHEPGGNGAWYLVETEPGLAGEDDARLAQALRPFGEQIARVVHLGGYAKPLSAQALGGTGRAP